MQRTKEINNQMDETYTEIKTTKINEIWKMKKETKSY
jgi:hypothetical protein